MINDLRQIDPSRFDDPAILKALNKASRELAEFKGTVESLPNSSILITTLGLQEAQESSEIESIVTTQDDLYQLESHRDLGLQGPAKEVSRYGEALQAGFLLMKENRLITANHLTEIQRILRGVDEGIRTVPGTALRAADGSLIYSPPQDADEIRSLLAGLETFINEPWQESSLDPLIKMALIHHQFESIHPYSDGNGRTGRILNVLYLVKEGLLDLPVLYLSRPILRTKDRYYSLLQAVRDDDKWEEWTAYLLACVEDAARQGRHAVVRIREAQQAAKLHMRREHKFYSHELLNHLYAYPYTRIEHLMQSLGVSRPTASRYLKELEASGLLSRVERGRNVYYVNTALWQILSEPAPTT